MQIFNIQESLKKHEKLLRNTSRMYEGMAPDRGFTSVGFHSDTLITIIILGTILTLATYAGYHCLRRGVLCPRSLISKAMNNNKSNPQ